MQNLTIFTDLCVARFTFLRTFTGILLTFTIKTYTKAELHSLFATQQAILWATGPAPALALHRYNSWAKTPLEAADLSIYCTPTGEVSYQIGNEWLSPMLFGDITRLSIPTTRQTRLIRRHYAGSYLLL